MNSYMFLWYAGVMGTVVLGIVTVRTFIDSVSESTPPIKKALAPALAFYSLAGTLGWVALLSFAPKPEYFQPKFGYITLSVLAAIFAAWSLGLFSTETDEEESSSVVETLKRVLPTSIQEAIEATYGVDPKKPNLAEKLLFVDESTPATEGWWAGVSNWRSRDFKGSLIQWLRENGPKSHLIPATGELCKRLSLGHAYWIKNIVYSPEGVSLKIWDKKFFFKWEDLFFHVEYDLYGYSTVEVSETSVVFKPAQTFHLVAKDGTEIGWQFNSHVDTLGNFRVEVKFPEKVATRDEGYIFEYQDGLSGCYGQDIPVYYFASDLAKKVMEEKKAEKAKKKVAKKS